MFFFSFLFILKTQCKTDKNNSINKKEYLLFHNLKKKSTDQYNKKTSLYCLYKKNTIWFKLIWYKKL